jgi:hypothetical protein
LLCLREEFGAQDLSIGTHAPIFDDGEATAAIECLPAYLRASRSALRTAPMLKAVAEFSGIVNEPGDLDPIHQLTEFEQRFGIGCSISRRPMLRMALAGRELSLQFVKQTSHASTSRTYRPRVDMRPGVRFPFAAISLSGCAMTKPTDTISRKV